MILEIKSALENLFNSCCDGSETLNSKEEVLVNHENGMGRDRHHRDVCLVMVFVPLTCDFCDKNVVVIFPLVKGFFF